MKPRFCLEANSRGSWAVALLAALSPPAVQRRRRFPAQAESVVLVTSVSTGGVERCGRRTDTHRGTIGYTLNPRKHGGPRRSTTTITLTSYSVEFAPRRGGADERACSSDGVLPVRRLVQRRPGPGAERQQSRGRVTTVVATVDVDGRDLNGNPVHLLGDHPLDLHALGTGIDLDHPRRPPGGLPRGAFSF